MPRLIYFGDSFIVERPEPYAWPRLLAQKYGFSAEYRSFTGTPIEYTSTKFHEYLLTDYNEDDIIIVVLTSSSRAPLVHEDYKPFWSAMYKFSLLETDLFEKFGDPRLTDHMTEHKQYYETWLQYFNPMIHQATCHLIARTVDALPNKTLVLSGFKDSDPKNTGTKVECHPGGNLFDLSCLEYKDDYTVEGFRGRDDRANHFCEENHHIMLDYVYSCLENGCTDIDYGKFKQRLYTRNK